MTSAQPPIHLPINIVAFLVALFSVATASQGTHASAAIDEETVKEWSVPFRGWHYYPTHVIPAKPGIEGYKDVKMTDVPTVFRIPGDEKWYMTFIGFDGKGYQSFIAESEDLVTWTNMRLTMGYGPEGAFDHGGVVLGAYLYESYDIKAPRTLKKKDGKYWSLYGAYPRQGGYELRPGYEGVASSKDGLNWSRAKDEPILSIYQEDRGEWEQSCIYQPWLVEHDGRYYNFYNAANGGIEQTGLALSDDLLGWTRYASNPVVPTGPEGSYNEKFSADPKVFRHGDHWINFFFGVGRGGAHIMAAFSRDLIHWTVDPEPLYKADGNPSGLDKKYAHKISLIWNPKNETYYLFYNAVGNQGRGIGVITSKPLMNQKDNMPNTDDDEFNLVAIERSRILSKAEGYLSASPRTVTLDLCDRSEGGPHDYYSEGDYWWPNPENPEGPYIRRDGKTNPDNFIAHRKSLIRLSDIIGTLTSAYLLTGKEIYASQAVAHLKAWFVDEATRMHPSLLYGQAIKGRHTGRSIGIIDTIHLVEVARGAKLLADAPAFSSEDQKAVKAWFETYLDWINTHPYGKEEKQHPNNHGVCWSLQAAAFADLVGDGKQLAWIREQFKNVYLKEMMNEEGGFPAELKRTKPYGYSLFVIDAMAGVAQLASTPEDNLWTCELPDGRGMKKGMEFIFPYIADKASWPYPPDVMYWDEWPVRHPSLLFAGLQFENGECLSAWEKLEADPETFEVIRNLPIRHPLLWVAKTEDQP